MRTSTKLIGITGVILLLAALLIAIDITAVQIKVPGVKDGTVVGCNVYVQKGLFTGYYDITTATCNKGSTCSTINPFFLGDEPTGELVLKQNGKEYSSISIDESRFSIYPTAYQITGCIPGTPTSVQVQALNKNGGIDDEVTTSVQ